MTEAPLFIKGDDCLSAVDRLNIYANMYFFRIRDALKEDFPLLLAELGDDGFHNLVTEYLVAHPPTHFSLRYAGRHLAEFISDENLSNIAHFEWAQIEAFDAADAALLTESDLQKIPAENWPNWVLKLHPSVQLLGHDHQIVWRQGFEVVQLSVPAEEWKLLFAICNGAHFAGLCAQTDAEKMSIHLRNWLILGLLCAP